MNSAKAPARRCFAWLPLAGKARLIFSHGLTTICMEKTSNHPISIIADTSALVSLATDTDHNHQPAKEAAIQLYEAQRPIILPTEVLVETVNILGKRSGHETALKAASELLRPGGQFILI